MEGQGSKSSKSSKNGSRKIIEDCEKASREFREKIEKKKQDIQRYNNILYGVLAEYLNPKVIDTIATLRRTYIENVLDSDVEDKSASYLNKMMSETVEQLANRNETLKKHANLIDFESDIDKNMIELANLEKHILLIEEVKRERVIKTKNLLRSIDDMEKNSSLVKFVDSLGECYADLANPSPRLTEDVTSLKGLRAKFEVDLKDLREKVKTVCGLDGDCYIYDDSATVEESIVGNESGERADQSSSRSRIGLQGAHMWEAGQGANSSQDKLGSLFLPPFQLMHTCSFEKAKFTAKSEDKWFLVNVQSAMEFSSLQLNRDTWGNKTVAETITSSFIFWQAFNDTEDGRKVCTDYKLEGAPVTLVIDPFTGKTIRSWRGMIQPDDLLSDLVSFLDASPNKYYASLSHERPEESSHSTPQKIQEVPDVGVEEEELQRALAASMGNKDAVVKSDKEEEVKADNSDIKEKQSKPSYPPLPEEPKVADKNLLCMVGVRLPDGRMLQRNFLLTDPIQLLWSFCYSQFDEDEARPFELTQVINGASISLDYAKNLTFDESGLANSMVSVTWE